MSNLLQHLEEHQSKHQVGLTRWDILMEQKKEAPVLAFLLTHKIKFMQDASCKGTENHISAWFQKV